MSTTFRVNWKECAATTAVGACVVAFIGVGFNLASDPGNASGEVVSPVATPSAEPVESPTISEAETVPPSEPVVLDLPPCATEDSDNCYWDAGVQGNGEGTSFYVVDGNVTYETGNDVSPGAPWVQPCTDWLAEHGGTCEGEPLAWPYSNGETLVCGPDAKPALDYRSDGIGWWAYCEPALVGEHE